MRSIIVFVIGFTILVSGCAPMMPRGNASVGRWERRVLAEGVELDVRDDASPEARQIAEDFQSEIRSRYINARQ
jgi:hypothetical protein